jgi:restriction endonuclease S subunit
MKNGWKTRRLEEVCSEITDGSHFSPKTTDSGFPYITVRDIENDRIDFANCKFISTADYMQLLNNGCRPYQGNLLFSKDGTVGKVALVDYDKDFVVLSSLAIVRPDNRQINSAFLKYVLKSRAFLDEAVGMKTGVAIRRIILRNLKSISIPVPPLPEQQRIVEILDEAFDGIAIAEANAESTLLRARAIFESYVQSLFGKSETGAAQKKLGDESLLEIIDGDRGVNYPKASDFHDEEYCLFLNTKNVRPDGFNFETAMFITAEKDRQLRKGKLTRDDVVMTTRGTIGNIGLYSEDIPFDNIRINSGMLIFRPNKRVLLPSFLFELLRSDIVKDQIRKYTTGAAQPQLPIKTLVDFTIPVPVNLAHQRELVKKLRAFEAESKQLVSIHEQKLTLFEALKESLLHQALTGKL